MHERAAGKVPRGGLEGERREAALVADEWQEVPSSRADARAVFVITSIVTAERSTAAPAGTTEASVVLTPPRGPTLTVIRGSTCVAMPAEASAARGGAAGVRHGNAEGEADERDAGSHTSPLSEWSV